MANEVARKDSFSDINAYESIPHMDKGKCTDFYG